MFIYVNVHCDCKRLVAIILGAAYFFQGVAKNQQLAYLCGFLAIETHPYILPVWGSRLADVFTKS